MRRLHAVAAVHRLGCIVGQAEAAEIAPPQPALQIRSAWGVRIAEALAAVVANHGDGS
jgi:hypothetical protein